MHRCALQVAEEYNGKLPSSYTDLLKLPGIGDYTSSIIASICYAEPVPVVDGNIVRVVSRLFSCLLLGLFYQPQKGTPDRLIIIRTQLFFRKPQKKRAINTLLFQLVVTRAPAHPICLNVDFDSNMSYIRICNN